MSPRDTRTGGVLEEMVLPALRRGGYSFPPRTGRTRVGLRPGGRDHFADVVATDAEGNEHLISMKWQQTSGTAEQKVPFEVICLIHAQKTSERKYKSIHLVLGGSGWTLRDYYCSGGLREYIPESHLVKIVSLEDFVGKANKGQL